MGTNMGTMADAENIMKTGTTTLGLVCKDGIVLAADRRATAGYLIAQKNTQKLHIVTDTIAVTMAGTASDAQLLIRVAQAELKLKSLRTNNEVTVKEAANLFARMVYNNIRKMSMIPGVSHFVMGGKDDAGFHVYDIFPDGTISKVDDYISSGSGSVMVYGVLETMFKKDMSTEEGTKLAIKSVNAAMQRDIASGNGIDVLVINKDGVKFVYQKEMNTKIEG